MLRPDNAPLVHWPSRERRPGAGHWRIFPVNAGRAGRK